jgi:hypothetical protein
MKISCEVIRDLLPLYADDVCSDESKELVREHLDECLPCSVLLEEMKSGTVCRANASDEEAQANSFKRFKKKMACKTLRRALIVVCSALLVLSALFFWSYPIQYTEGLLDVHVAVDTVIDCVFQDGNYYRSHVMTRDIDGESVAFIYYSETFWTDYLYTPEHEDEPYQLSFGNGIAIDFHTNQDAIETGDVSAIYYLVGNYRKLETLSDEAFAEASQDAVLLWSK